MTERENALLAIAHREPEWVPAVFDCTINCGDVINDRPLFEDGVDCFGVHWKRSGPETNFITHVDPAYPPVIGEVARWRDGLKLPDLDSFDWAAAAPAITPEARREKLVLYIMGMGLFERVTTLMDYEEALCSMLEEPEEFSALLSALADHKVDLVEHIARYLRPDVIYYHDDWATQNGPFFSKAVWEELIKPHTQRIYNAILAHGIHLVHHSCGKVESFLPDMVDMGVQGWNSCQDCNDLAGIKARLGDRLVFWGALNDQGVLGQKGTTDDMLRQEAVYKTDLLAAGGGWLCGPNAYVSFDFDQDRKCDAYVKEYSRDFYARRR